jgi:hypothetical protein
MVKSKCLLLKIGAMDGLIHKYYAIDGNGDTFANKLYSKPTIGTL